MHGVCGKEGGSETSGVTQGDGRSSTVCSVARPPDNNGEPKRREPLEKGSATSAAAFDTHVELEAVKSWTRELSEHHEHVLPLALETETFVISFQPPLRFLCPHFASEAIKCPDQQTRLITFKMNILMSFCFLFFYFRFVQFNSLFLPTSDDTS